MQPGFIAGFFVKQVETIYQYVLTMQKSGSPNNGIK
jgi:hypothetical protein